MSSKMTMVHYIQCKLHYSLDIARKYYDDIIHDVNFTFS